MLINVNPNFDNGRVVCGRATCNREIGKMRLDHIHILLFSYRKCRLIHASTLSEHDEGGSTNIIVNRLIEENEPLNYDFARNFRRSNSNEEAGNESAARLLELGLMRPRMNLNTGSENRETVAPISDGESGSAGSESGSGFLDRIVRDILETDCSGDNFLQQLISSPSLYDVVD